MTATLTMREVDIIQSALYCLLDHPDYLREFTPEELEKIVNPIDVKLETATHYCLRGEQLTIII